ncbi:MAG TPA: methyltransferase domain-containing protein, partial [Burkholderiales bacterium]|nr:methyltransferase domain-containing protein [Burkholderiales bacterium]
LLCRLGVIRSARTTRALLEDLFRDVVFAGRRVLDIGGGDGLYAFYAAIRGAREVVCLEPEADGYDDRAAGVFGAIARRYPGVPVRLERTRVQEHRDADGYDVIVMNASINHVDEDACMQLTRSAEAREAFRRVFAHIGGLARRAARLVVTDCSRHNFFAALGVRNPICPTIEWDKHQPPEVWASLLEEAGFARPRVRWEPLYRFGAAGQRLLGNRVAAYFLKSMFRLEMVKA